MRIRKNASKLILGSATSIYGSAIESPSNAFTFAPEVICELNCSPWDLMLFHHDPSDACDNFKEEDGGTLGNTMKTEMEPISCITSTTAAELTLKEMKEIESQRAKKKMKTNKSSNKGKEIAPEETSSIPYCKKSDGKGWHCKRPSLPNSRLCSYHLAQCRSYASNPSHKSSAADSSLTTPDNNNTSSSIDKNQQVRKTGDSNLYYYYGGFGPCRGKRRGRSADILVDNVCGSTNTSGSGGISIDAKEDQLVGNRESSVADECINDENVAGDDEYDLHYDDNCCGTQRDVEEIKEEQEGKEKKKVLKKRGRKPIKARSLKSLL